MKSQQMIINSINILKLRILLILLTLFATTTNSQSQSFDVFPLKSGMSYHYKYYANNIEGDGSIATKVIDSGRVYYVVSDSTIVNDTIVEWKISEVKDLSREIIKSSPMGGYDSIIIVRDTIEFILKEYLSGKHTITSSAAVWRFPLGHIRNEEKEFIYRINESHDQQLTFNWKDKFAITAYGTGFDSVFFSSTYGYYRRHFNESWKSGILSGTYIQKVELLNRPTEAVETEVLQPINTQLLQNYPNPFNPSTTFVFHLKDNEHASIKIYDMLGREIATVFQGIFHKGVNEFKWHPHNLSSGLYLYKLQTKYFAETKKLMYLK